jgi:DNA polymerase III alpha subunit
MLIDNDEDKLIQGILLHGVDIVEHTVLSQEYIQKYISRLEKEKLNYPVPLLSIDKNIWFMPDSYMNMDIEKYIIDLCPEENKHRAVLELEHYRKKNLLPLLKQIKYIVDILRKNNVVWGVGRGSSVASYVLFLLGIHKIDSVKYNLPLEEFFKGVENG